MIQSKIIHQVWEGKREPLPDFFIALGNTWRDKHPNWEYVYWDKQKMDAFVDNYFSRYRSIYDNLLYDVQRWDVIRYMILYQQGGLYEDFDYECLFSLEGLLDEENCCFGVEAKIHAGQIGKECIVGNALMYSEPGHPFMKKVLERSLSITHSSSMDKASYVLNTTDPFMLTDLYETNKNQDSVVLLPSDLIFPLSRDEITLYIEGKIDEELLNSKLEKAIAVHYYFGSWTK